MNELDDKHLESLTRHITHVQQNCTLLGQRLIDKGESEFGRKLIANGWIHDHSKFFGIEWKYMRGDSSEGSPEFKLSVEQHVSTNKHHPEHWDGIQNMPKLYIAEMVCDWSARSAEFGNDVRIWVKEKASKRFKFKLQSKVYKEIKEMLDILLDASFK